MKTKSHLARMLLTGSCFLLTAMAPAIADDLQTVFDQGRAAYYRGDYPAAKKLLAQIAAVQPAHYQTRAMLANIAAHEKSQTVNLKDQCAALRIPKFEVFEVPLAECLHALAVKTKDISTGKLAPNFVVKTASLNKSPLTINLQNTPVDEVVRYLAEMAGAKVSWEKHAVVFTGLAE
jgi:hypothetical protein